MRTFYASAVPALWTAWCIYWWIASHNVKPVKRKESTASRAGHILPLIVAVLLLALPTLPGGVLFGRLLPATRSVFFIGVVLVAAGLAFSGPIAWYGTPSIRACCWPSSDRPWCAATGAALLQW